MAHMFLATVELTNELTNCLLFGDAPLVREEMRSALWCLDASQSVVLIRYFNAN